MKRIVSFVCLTGFFVLFSSSVLAGDNSAKGVVNAVKADERKLNISHGPIPSMGMDAMTMDFMVMDPAMLDEVKKGHEVMFVLEKDKSGNFVITEIEDMGMAKGMPMKSGHSDDGHSH